VAAEVEVVAGAVEARVAGAEAEDAQGEAAEAGHREVVVAAGPSSPEAGRSSSGTRHGRGCSFRPRSARSGNARARVPTTWWASHNA